MTSYRDEPDQGDRDPRSVGVLLANLGTPDAPTPAALRRFLRQFLGDPRVIEEPRWKWWLILNLFILPFRPSRSAALYRRIWQASGSPLLQNSRSLERSVRETLHELVASPVAVATGMRYGNPSIAAALDELRGQGCRRLLVLPLFPQYSGTTVASVFDAVAAQLSCRRVVPSLRTIHQYHDEPHYIAALARSIRDLWERDGEPDKLLFSFHGIPLRYSTGGDPYPEQCRMTARLVAEALALAPERWVVAFQSIFGKEEWVQPATAATVESLAAAGVGRLDVVCPGFSMDCLETLEEIDLLNRQIFLDNGGRSFRYIRCLNDGPRHVEMVTDLVLSNLEGWIELRAGRRVERGAAGPALSLTMGDTP